MWLCVYHKKIPKYPIFYLHKGSIPLKGDAKVILECTGFRVEGLGLSVPRNHGYFSGCPYNTVRVLCRVGGSILGSPISRKLPQHEHYGKMFGPTGSLVLPRHLHLVWTGDELRGRRAFSQGLCKGYEPLPTSCQERAVRREPPPDPAEMAKLAVALRLGGGDGSFPKWGGPQYEPQHIRTLIIETRPPKRVPLISGKPKIGGLNMDPNILEPLSWRRSQKGTPNFGKPSNLPVFRILGHLFHKKEKVENHIKTWIT